MSKGWCLKTVRKRKLINLRIANDITGIAENNIRKINHGSVANGTEDSKSLENRKSAPPDIRAHIRAILWRITDLFELFIYKQHQSKHQRSVPVGAAVRTNTESLQRFA